MWRTRHQRLKTLTIIIIIPVRIFFENGSNYQASNNVAYSHKSQEIPAPVVKTSFPIVQPPPLVQKTGIAQNYGTRCNYAPSEKSWISAFSSPNRMVLSYNGGKDCTVLLDLVARVWRRFPEFSCKKLKTLYVPEKDPFPELETFIQFSVKK